MVYQSCAIIIGLRTQEHATIYYATGARIKIFTITINMFVTLFNHTPRYFHASVYNHT